MNYLSESTSILYTQLLSQCLHVSVPGGRGLSFVQKTIKGSIHWYLQLTFGSRKTQHYIGPNNEKIQKLIRDEKQLWESTKHDREDRERLVAMLISGGSHTVSAAEARLFELIERAGVFLVGGVLIGSHAFTLYGNMLGVSWPSKMIQTHDIDLTQNNQIALGLKNKPVNLKAVLLEANMGFVEVPAFDRKAPSTRFRIQGKQLSVDLLTPLIGKPTSKPVLISALKTYAEPLRFLDYLLDDTQPATMIARAGILLNVPAPARYALHKLVTSTRRIAALQTKALKDIDQAEQLLSVLIEDRPGDIQLAFEAAKKMPNKFNEQLQNGIKKLPENLVSSLKKYLT